MSKRNKKGNSPAEDQSSVAKDSTPGAEANGKLADFAKAQTAKAATAKAAKAAKVGKDGRPKLPPLPRKAGSPKPLVDCACGCGLKTRSKFAPGHDSRLRGWSLRVARGFIKMDEIPDGERQAVEAHIKELKKEGKYEALKTAQPPAKKKTAVNE